MHTAYVESIQELIDGTIGAIRRAELERHLATCEECRALMTDMQAIRDTADALEPLEPPAGVWLQIAGRLRQEGRGQAPPVPPATRAPRYAIFAIAASLVLAVGVAIAFLVTQYRAPNKPAPAPEIGRASCRERV